MTVNMQIRLRASICAGLALGGLAGVMLGGGCRRAEVPLPTLAAQPKPVDDTALFGAQQVGAPIDGHPWVAHVAAVDLDQDGLMDILVCDAQKNQVTWVRQTSPGQFQEIVLASDFPPRCMSRPST